MQNRRPVLLLTRSAGQSDRMAALARAEWGDLPVVIAPVLRIVGLPFADDLPAGAELIFTSENAVAVVAGAMALAGRRAWCVGARTAAVARETGADVIEAGGTAQSLIAMIKAARPDAPLVYLRGAIISRDIEHDLNQLGIATTSRIVYAQEPCDPGPQAAALFAGERPVIVPLFSVLSARRLGEYAASARAPLHLVAINDPVAQAWTGAAPASTHIADDFTTEAMLAAIRLLLQ